MKYTKAAITNEEIQDFIRKRVKINDESGCWEWNKSVASNGYGRLERTTRAYRHCQTRAVHRASYFVFKSEHPGDLVVRHRCNNKLCCNPNHLELGTNTQNLLDRAETLVDRSTPALIVMRNFLLSKIAGIDAKIAEIDVELTKRNPPKL